MIQRVMDPDCCIISLNCLRLGCFQIERPRHVDVESDTHTHTLSLFKPIPSSGSYLSINQSANPEETKRERKENESKGGRESQSRVGDRVSLWSRIKEMSSTNIKAPPFREQP